MDILELWRMKNQIAGFDGAKSKKALRYMQANAVLVFTAQASGATEYYEMIIFPGVRIAYYAGKNTTGARFWNTYVSREIDLGVHALKKDMYDEIKTMYGVRFVNVDNETYVEGTAIDSIALWTDEFETFETTLQQVSWAAEKSAMYQALANGLYVDYLEQERIRLEEEALAEEEEALRLEEEEKLKVVEEWAWWPDAFPLTEGLHMVFWAGNSFYIPDHCEIVESIQRKMDLDSVDRNVMIIRPTFQVRTELSIWKFNMYFFIPKIKNAAYATNWRWEYIKINPIATFKKYKNWLSYRDRLEDVGVTRATRQFYYKTLEYPEECLELANFLQVKYDTDPTWLIERFMQGASKL
jgi:hypothetical protein